MIPELLACAALISTIVLWGIVVFVVPGYLYSKRMVCILEERLALKEQYIQRQTELISLLTNNCDVLKSLLAEVQKPQ